MNHIHKNIYYILINSLKQDEFASDVEKLKLNLLETTKQMLSKLEEEKNLLLLKQKELSNGTINVTLKRKVDDTSETTEVAPTTNKKKTANPNLAQNSYFNYTLKDAEVMEDLRLIHRATTNHPSYSKQLPLKY